MVIEEHKNKEATIRIHDDNCTTYEESLKILRKTGETVLSKLVSIRKSDTD